MAELETAITQKGQVTIPQPVRKALGLRPRDRVRFELGARVVRERVEEAIAADVIAETRA